MNDSVSIENFKPNFFIDRQFGYPIQIEVANGIIVKFAPSDLEPKLSTEYVGKTISYFKEHFETRMKPAFYCVKNLDWVHEMTNLQILAGTKYQLISVAKDLTAQKKIEDHYRNPIFHLNTKVIEIAKKIKEEHNFDTPILEFTY